MKKAFISFTLVFMAFIGFSQNIWQGIEANSLQGSPQITAKDALYFELDYSNWKTLLFQAPEKTTKSQTSPVVVELPMADGTMDKFMVFEAPIMEEALANKYPELKTFIFASLSNQLSYGRADITHKGFHLMLFTEKGSMFIDPVSQANNLEHIVYWKDNFTTNKPLPACLSTDEAEGEEFIDLMDNTAVVDHSLLNMNKSNKDFNGTTLRTYRLAVSATGEYTAFQGGTVVDGLAAVVTSINRVNGIYEREFTARLVLVADNDQIIYTNAGTDPFGNPNNPGQLLNENQNSVDNVIGSNNYDVGHVVGRSGSGLASYGVVCRNTKAQGTTGVSNPVGDPFDVDYLAHELGHQFAGSHTFNSTSGSCAGNNLSSNSAYEPGSATTIMGYAGICAPHNIQNNSDDYFHTRTFDQVVAFTTQFQGNNCPVKTATGNTIPQIQIITPNSITIPISTPFELEAFATDVDGDALTYCWEQFDLGPNGDPNNPTGNAPLFRSFKPILNPIRTFPQIDDIVNNTQTIGEILPDYGRDMDFRITVRDNVPGGGAVNYEELDINVSNTSGPFLVQSPNTNVNWVGGVTYDILWDVANTTSAPVNCNEVNILLSTDGGYTYNIVLASNVPNNGSASIVAPFAITTKARVRVEAADNIFFDISDVDFQISTNCSSVDPTINLDEDVQDAIWCVGANGTLSFSASSADLLITSYQWFYNGNVIPGATNNELLISNVQVANAGNYYCTVSNGCSSMNTSSVVVTIATTPIIPTISLVGNQLKSSLPYGNQWYRNGELLANETGQYITYTPGGSYNVGSVAGECSAFSDAYVTGLKDLNALAKISISPNPTNGLFQITTDWQEDIQVEVHNVLGQGVLTPFTFNKNTNVDLSSFTNGLYIVTLSSDSYVSSSKVMKK